MKTIVSWLACGIVLSAAPASATVRVVATTTDLADIAAAVGGDLVHVDAICSGQQDPHHVQARPSYMVTLSRADLVISVGFELEVGWLPSLVAGARNPGIAPGGAGYYEAAAAVTPIDVVSGAVDRRSGDVHPDGNPHYWLNPDNAGPIAQGIAGALAAVDSGNAATYRANADAFEARVAARISGWEAQLSPYAGTQVASYHMTFNYLLRRFGIGLMGVVEDRPGIPPSPSHLAELTRAMRDGGVRVLLHESYYDRAASDRVATESGATVIELPTSVGGADGTDDYIALIDHLVTELARALGGDNG